MATQTTNKTQPTTQGAQGAQTTGDEGQSRELVPAGQPALTHDEALALLPLLKRVRALRDELSARFIERGDVIDALLMGIISRQHVMMIGDPGEGKTATTEALAARIDGRYFYTLLGGQSHVDDIIGPLNTKLLMEGVREHDLEGFAATAHVVFIDEIAKANESTLNGALLPLMNERRVPNGKTLVRTPLEILVGASNEEFALDAEDTVTGHSLRALWDRFTLRVIVKTLTDAGHRQYMQDEILRQMREAMGEDVSGKTGAVTIGLDELHLLQKAALLVQVPNDVMEAWYALRQALRKVGLQPPSTRGSGWMLRVVKAHALLRGSTVVSRADLIALCAILWDRADQAAQVRAKVLEVALPLTKEAVELGDKAMGATEQALQIAQRGDVDDSSKMNALVKGTREVRDDIKKRVLELRDMAVARNEDPAEMDRVLANIEVMLRQMAMAMPVNI